ncbi:MAG: UDP-N-acetylmuramate--L-alanine ligase [Pelagibacteraceae bacterium TMED237]|nr:MAG: UDP-N-acetylmuramate--L-alanine ligase [Pelagibacteraceae bacterium TMED237]|tara:strand:+ start:3404 stop:4774 length:1371 start_codon:yes stop_codon:yes gene_type:complete
MKNNIRIHFIGISGIGMSGIAELMQDKGYMIQGSDITLNENTKRLKKKGIKFFLGHNKKNINKVDAVVFSSAINNNNPEIKEALSKKIPLLSRADMLAELMKNKKSIAIAGSHGKTTTTSLVGNIFSQANLDPTIVNGGIINSLSKNNRYGKGEWMVVEADESDGSFLKLPHQISIITNLDIEHLDFYKSKDNLFSAFENFVNMLPFHGTSIICLDDKNLQSLVKKIKTRNIITYAIKNKKADILIYDIKGNTSKTSFKLKIKNKIIGKSNYKFIINAIGNHNLLNCTASIIASKIVGVKNIDINKALINYIGVKRRFTLLGKKNDAMIYDDYAHHPTEISATLNAAKNLKKNVIVVFQPHRYSRTKILINEFVNILSKIDHLIILDTYSAGEKKIKGFTSKDIYLKVIKLNKNITYLKNLNNLKKSLMKYSVKKNIIIFMGAGSISNIAKNYFNS